jgi:hypothetical protein
MHSPIDDKANVIMMPCIHSFLFPGTKNSYATATRQRRDAANSTGVSLLLPPLPLPPPLPPLPTTFTPSKTFGTCTSGGCSCWLARPARQHRLEQTHDALVFTRPVVVFVQGHWPA